MVKTGATPSMKSCVASAVEGSAPIRREREHLAYCAVLPGKPCMPIDAELLRMFWWKAVVEVVSAEGITLFAKFSVDAGAYLVVELQNDSQGPSRAQLARVNHASKRVDGSWHVACSFENLKED
jgi:hypothetical protein